MQSQGPSHIVRKETVSETRWLRFVKVMYANEAEGKTMPWDAVERVTTAEGGIDAVIAVTIVKKIGQQPKLLIVKQFRPAAGKYTVELCAGLVDPGESPNDAALRELKEETGYVGKIVTTTGRGLMSPGITNENIVTVFIEVDGDAPENQNPIQLGEDDAELIKRDYLSMPNLYEELERLEKEGFGIWVGLWSLAQGMRLAKLMPSLAGAL